MGVNLFIDEGGLHQTLAIVESAIDFDGSDILAKSGKLTLLDGTDLTLGIEHIDVDALHSQETVGHSRTRVAGSGNEDIDDPSPSLPRGRGEILQQTGHEAGTDVLESEGGTMEEFKAIDAFLDLHQWTVEGEGFGDDSSEVVGRDILAKETVCHSIGYLMEGEVRHFVEKLFGQGFDTFGHV